jgi:hypothetical protein
MAWVAEGLQIGMSAVPRTVVQVGHCHQLAPGIGSEVSHHGALVRVVGGANAIAEFLYRFSRANAGPPAELTAPVGLGLNLGGDHILVRRVKLAVPRHDSSPIHSSPKTTTVARSSKGRCF